ncbi:hypothetical protein J4Q44_G00217900 [Coregonus suidteri]|uniref:Uncharacterized protein n=1 Tax=Coregonus suidteri TaxID=861788 RepID=A0AAN8LFB8_9TELE
MTSLACLDPGAVREGHQNKPNFTRTTMSEDTGGKVPWYMTLLHEKEQNILMFGEEITHWSEFEEECLKKDQDIISHNEDVARGQGGSRDSSALYISDFCESIVAHTCTELEVVTFSFAVVEKVPNVILE